MLAAIGLVISLAACSWTSRTGDLQEQSETIDLEGAESVVVNLRMGAGELTVRGGSDALVDAEFIYNVDEWEPTIDYAVSGDEGELWIEQPEVGSLSLESYRYEWILEFNEDVPMEMNVDLGAGVNELDVSALSLTRLDLEMGVGDLNLDLTGEREQDLDVSIRGGVGSATVLLPADVGVRAEVTGGLGSIDVDGLTREGDVYVNEAYEESDMTVNLDIEAGVGEIDLQVVDG